MFLWRTGVTELKTGKELRSGWEGTFAFFIYQQLIKIFFSDEFCIDEKLHSKIGIFLLGFFFIIKKKVS